MTFCPLAIWLAETYFQQHNQEEYITIGGWLDSKMAIINNCTNETKLAYLPGISLETYSADLKKAAGYKAKFIHLFHNGILAIPVKK